MITVTPAVTRPPIYVIDALNYIFRAYYGLPGSITAPSGMQTNAVLGYVRMLLRIVKERKPQYIAAAFESKTSFRSQMFTEYKATRAPTPTELKPQIDYCRKITEALGIASFEVPDYEADDVIGTIATRMRSEGHAAVIVSGDKDMSQLVADGVFVYDFAKETWLRDEAAVRDKFGVTPSQIPDLLALIGDSVDNIPGVSGVGEKTARQLLAACLGIEQLANPLEWSGTMSIRNRGVILRRIRENIDAVRMSRKLATICCDIPMAVSPESLRYRRGNPRTLTPLCDELGFQRVLDDIPMMAQPMLF